MATETTRQRLLAAARKVLLEEGLEAASVRSVTTEARANVAAIHYHFGSRDGLVREVVGEAARNLSAAWSLEAEDDDSIRLESVLETFLSSLIKNRPRAALVARALVGSDARLRNAVSAELARGLASLESIIARLEPELERRSIHLALCQVLGSSLLWLPDRALLERLGDTRYRWDDEADLRARWVGMAIGALRSGAPDHGLS
ncbi:MAG: TetR/AcrR family transcriptional regulator [Thermoanaerobaculia bacterium]|nr:TetR/AcrR family transcriptional regulator [Thermoanaerobaculia bacterium]